LAIEIVNRKSSINHMALSIAPGECVAVVGAGGKTALCWLLTRALAARGDIDAHVVFSTTTHIWQPAPGAFDLLHVGSLASAREALTGADWRTACVASAITGDVDATPVSESLMPVLHTRLAGYSVGEIDELMTPTPALPLIGGGWREAPGGGCTLILEADGARGRWLKAPTESEPAIPACATTVCVVANLAVLGQPLDERSTHRPKRIAALTGAHLGQPVTAQTVVDVLAHAQGGRKGIPPSARAIAVLMQYADTPHPDAAWMLDALVERGFDQALLLAPRVRGLEALLEQTCGV
jgi:hypothetical protein